jgi:prepilin-type processing-associated H-X9-DG protein
MRFARTFPRIEKAACGRPVHGVSSRAAPRPVPSLPGRRANERPGFTLLELLVLLGIVGILLGILLAAVQKVREAAQRAQCLSHLKQIGMALHSYHDANQTFPHAYDARALFQDPSRTPATPAKTRFLVTQSWATLLLPFLEQENLAQAGYDVYRQRHVPLYACPSDPRSNAFYPGDAQYSAQALTDYLAVTGTTTFNGDPEALPRPQGNGVIYESSRTRLADITDGASNTVLVGERPPSLELYWGWWAWSAFDTSLGVRNDYPVYGTAGGPPVIACPRLFPENYRPNTTRNCDTHHFWSMHPVGGNWLFADGSVRFLPYRANALLPALATRSGGEDVSADD